MPPISLWAHSANHRGDRQTLRDHLIGTATLARTFTAPFGAGDLGYALGLLHDIGKANPDWQSYLLASEAWRANQASTSPAPTGPGHKQGGACIAATIAGLPGLLTILGHHRGIPDGDTKGVYDDARNPALEQQVLRTLADTIPEVADVLAAPSPLPAHWGNQDEWEAAEFRIRMMHSALVDADWLDTNAHSNSTGHQVRPAADFHNLANRFLTARTTLLAGRTRSPIDALRTQLFNDAVTAAAGQPGIYRLPGPTGSGKTMSSAAFALEHARIHGKRRVVVAVPFMTITEQNAAVYRDLLGSHNIIEHHSRVESDDWETRVSVENWDAPFVMTTTVQLFESMFSNRPSRTRKLHRLVDSVIVLDELQAVPTHLLPVILDGLRLLVRYFGATVLLSSATQPAWDALKVWSDNTGTAVTDVVPDPATLYRNLRRTTTAWITEPTLGALAARVAGEDRALVIVNTTRDAHTLAVAVAAAKPGTTVHHLSTLMYSDHRAVTLNAVRDHLRKREPVIVVSTQLVEAGVDLDFPAVYRAAAPAENLIQAAGRCNREGLLATGRFHVVTCPEFTPLPAHRTGMAITNNLFRTQAGSLHDPVAVRTYFEELYSALRIDWHPPALEMNGDRANLRFDTIARQFRMIDDITVGAVVEAAPGARQVLNSVSARVAAGNPVGPDGFRSLQKFTASVPQKWCGKVPDLDEELPGVWVWRGHYDPFTGIARDEGDNL